MLLESFGSADAALDMDALSALLSVEDCFLLQFKRRNKITSVEFIKIYGHYDEAEVGSLDGPGFPPSTHVYK